MNNKTKVEYGNFYTEELLLKTKYKKPVEIEPKYKHTHDHKKAEIYGNDDDE